MAAGISPATVWEAANDDLILSRGGCSFSAAQALSYLPGRFLEWSRKLKPDFCASLLRRLRHSGSSAMLMVMCRASSRLSSLAPAVGDECVPARFSVSLGL
jgi:hypothetical protein